MSIREYRELEAGQRSPNWETLDRICKLHGWSQTFTEGNQWPVAKSAPGSNRQR